MRIQQAYVGCKSFQKAFLAKFHLRVYNNPHQPAVFFGVYRNQWSRLLAHKSLGVVVWAGSDAMNLPDTFIKSLKARPNLRHIAISNFIAKDLEKYGLPYTMVPITPHVFAGYKAEKLGSKVYVYLPDSDIKQRNFYGGDVVDKIRKEMPDLKFVFTKPGEFDKRSIMQLYKDCFMGLRLTPHDGMSNTVVELGLMGRRVVWNGEAPNAIPYSNYQDVIQAIRTEREKIGTKDTVLAKAVQKFIEVGEDWLECAAGTFVEKVPEEKSQYVSVIINTVNEKPEILLAAINSYLNQQKVKVQVILSTIEGDPSLVLGKKLGLTLSISPQKGIYEQLNYALQYVYGDWVTYASGNDLACPLKLYDETAMCLKEKKLICYSDYMRISANMEPLQTFHSPEYMVRRHLQGNFVNDCAMIHRSLLTKFGPFDLKWGNHAYWDFWLRVYEGMGNVFCHNRKVEWFYRMEDTSQHIQRRKDPEKIKINNDLRVKLLDYHKRLLKIP